MRASCGMRIKRLNLKGLGNPKSRWAFRAFDESTLPPLQKHSRTNLRGLSCACAGLEFPARSILSFFTMSHVTLLCLTFLCRFFFNAGSLVGRKPGSCRAEHTDGPSRTWRYCWEESRTGSFRKLGVPYFWVLIIRILLFWGSYNKDPTI